MSISDFQRNALDITATISGMECFGHLQQRLMAFSWAESSLVIGHSFHKEIMHGVWDVSFMRLIYNQSVLLYYVANGNDHPWAYPVIPTAKNAWWVVYFDEHQRFGPKPLKRVRSLESFQSHRQFSCNNRWEEESSMYFLVNDTSFLWILNFELESVCKERNMLLSNWDHLWFIENKSFKTISAASKIMDRYKWWLIRFNPLRKTLLQLFISIQ